MAASVDLPTNLFGPCVSLSGNDFLIQAVRLGHRLHAELPGQRMHRDLVGFQTVCCLEEEAGDKFTLARGPTGEISVLMSVLPNSTILLRLLIA